MSILENLVWRVTAPPLVRQRYQEIAADLQSLLKKKILPRAPRRILDAESGSGAGSVALRRQYPQARVFAVDDASSFQTSVVYRVRSPPRSVSFHQLPIQKFAKYHEGEFDLVVGAHLNFDSPVDDRAESMGLFGRFILSLLSMVKGGGTLAVSWPSNCRQNSEKLLTTNLRTQGVFDSVTRQRGSVDPWIVFSGLRSKSLEPFKKNPRSFLK